MQGDDKSAGHAAHASADAERKRQTRVLSSIIHRLPESGAGGRKNKEQEQEAGAVSRRYSCSRVILPLLPALAFGFPAPACCSCRPGFLGRRNCEQKIDDSVVAI